MAEPEVEAAINGPETAAPPPPAEEQRSSLQPGLLRDRYLVRSAHPLPELSTPSASAFATEDRRDPNRALFALICKPELPPRVTMMRALKGVSSPGIQQLVEWGPLSWPPAGRQCMAVVYERPAGPRIMTSLRGEVKRFDEYVISRKVIEPLAMGIREMTQRGLTHRSIRPTNLFAMDGNGERLAFGDCLTAPPAFDQPILFETIESGMCNPIARGSGTYADDLYSLGVTIAILLMGRNPVGGLSDETILSLKIQMGSYNTLIGDERLPMSLIELLRGLLCDDSSQRWTFEDLELWMSGRRMSPLQPRGEKRAARGFAFMGKEYLNCRELAQAMARNWDQAIPPVIEGKVELWLRRAVEDKDKAALVSDVVRVAINATTDKKSALDLMLCKVLILLDPSAPIRYKGFNAMPDGFGSALAAVVASRGDTRLLAEMIAREVPRLWFDQRGEYQPDNSLMESNFRELRAFMGQPGLGFGLERCLYEMNDALPLQCSMVGEDYVVDIKELLPALNRAAARRGDGKQPPVDRHIAAFMGARMRADIDRNLGNLSDPNPAISLMALINMFAVLQYRFGPESLPGLTSWLTGSIDPVVAAFHSREKRKTIEKELPRIARKGSIVELYHLLDNAEERNRDQKEFLWAQAQYLAADEEIRHILTETEERAKEADRIGRQAAAMTGIMIAMAVAAVVVVSSAF